MKNKYIPISILIIIACIAAFALYQTSNAPTVVKTSTNTSDNSTTKLSFLFDWNLVASYAPFIYAKELGFYEEEGIDVSFIEGRGAETSAKLISDGRYVIGTCNAAATATAVENGLGVISIAVIETDAITSVFSLSKSNITEPKDLAGKIVGVRHYDISHKDYLAMLEANGIKSSDINEVGVGFELQPLLTGKVDALYNYAYNMPVQLRSQGHEINELLVRDWGVDAYGSNIIANIDFAATNPELVAKFLRATIRGFLAANDNPEAAISALRKMNPQLNLNASIASLQAMLLWVIPEDANVSTLFNQSNQKWESALTTYNTVGIIKEKLDPEQVYTNNYLEE